MHAPRALDTSQTFDLPRQLLLCSYSQLVLFCVFCFTSVIKIAYSTKMVAYHNFFFFFIYFFIRFSYSSSKAGLDSWRQYLWLWHHSLPFGLQRCWSISASHSGSAYTGSYNSTATPSDSSHCHAEAPNISPKTKEPSQIEFLVKPILKAKPVETNHFTNTYSSFSHHSFSIRQWELPQIPSFPNGADSCQATHLHGKRSPFLCSRNYFNIQMAWCPKPGQRKQFL